MLVLSIPTSKRGKEVLGLRLLNTARAEPQGSCVALGAPGSTQLDPKELHVPRRNWPRAPSTAGLTGSKQAQKHWSVQIKQMQCQGSCQVTGLGGVAGNCFMQSGWQKLVCRQQLTNLKCLICQHKYDFAFFFFFLMLIYFVYINDSIYSSHFLNVSEGSD